MLLERREALDQLSQLLTQAASGRGQVALIGGEAGIGKTSLLREFAGHAHPASAAPLWGGCDPMFTPRPLGPVHDIAKALGAGVAAALGRDNSRLEVFTACSTHWVATPIAWCSKICIADEATLDLLAYLAGASSARARCCCAPTARRDRPRPSLAAPARLPPGFDARSSHR